MKVRLKLKKEFDLLLRIGEIKEIFLAVIKQRSKSVRDAARMFQNVAEESAKAKPSTPQSVRRMPNRQSIQTDQPKASMTGVVRVAVPVPVSNKY